MSFLLFKRYFFSRRAGALIRIISRLSVAGIAVGICAMIVVMSVMNGFNEDIHSKILKAKPHIVIYQSSITGSLRDQLQGIEGLELVPTRSNDFILRSFDGRYSGVILRGLAEKDLNAFLQRMDEDFSEFAGLSSRQLILGVGVASDLGLLEGDEVLLIPPESLLKASGEVADYSRVTVSALVETGVPDIDGRLAFYNSALKSGFSSSVASLRQNIEIRLKSEKQVAGVAKILSQAGVPFETWKERDASLFYALKMEKMLIALFIGLSTLITSFSIVTVLTMLITQKKKEIGLLMALGVSDSGVKKVFLNLGLLLSGLGLFAGMVLGVILCLFLQSVDLDLLPNIYSETSIPVVMDASVLIFTFVGGSVLCFLGSWLPTQLYLKLTPAEALRT